MASLDDPGDVREGFLCPLCLKDLQSFYQLQSHYEEEHSGEDRDVKGQIKSLFQKAKKAKNKLLRREGDEQAEPGAPGYESFSNGGVDPYMWEPQELGTMRSHLSEFKKHRAARIDHYVVEVNKLIIRLEKLTAFDRTNTESAKIRAIEKSVVPWVNDQDVPFCPDCGSKFSIRNRRHHCRLCGSIMCKKCMELISLLLANKLTSASRDALSTHTSPNQSPGSVHGSRRGSIGSVSSMSSVLDEKENERIRCCRHCKDTLLRREQQMDEREHTPAITRLYESHPRTQHAARAEESWVPSVFADKLTSASRDALSTHTSPNQSPGSVHGSRRGSIGSVSSMSSVLDEKENERIRCCRHCKDTLLRREQQMDEREHTPAITRLYEKLRLCMAKVDQKAPEYTRMAASLNAGETTYSLEQASDLRLEVQKMYELIDALSKKILTLGLNQDPPPHPTTLRLQRMIRYSATLFVQEKLLGLMSLPTKEQFEELKKKRKQDMERKRMLERQAAPESQCRLEDKQRGPAANGEVAPTRKAEGWLPLPETQGQREDPDPLLQQIHNIESFIKQAQAASRTDEVRTLGENLRQLQDEYDRQQTAKAIELSRRQAEEEALQCEQLQRLREREWERERKQAASLHSRTQALDSREAAPFLLEPSRGPRPHPAFALELGSSSGSGMAPETPSPCAVWALSQESLHQSTEPQQNDCALNSFSRDFFSSPAVVQAKLPREYNPFEEEEEEEEEAVAAGNPFTSPDSPAPNPFDSPAPNPFEDGNDVPNRSPASPPVPSNPFEEPTGTNPFEVDSDSCPEAEEPIEEDLLLQQINNIKAYIFDAKQYGRLDEVEVLTENLRELRCTLAKQKGPPE
ncbi:Rabenosyn-5 [Heterocephalus glaber]|uniref:Rabenosyn-5 n=1 Tax=Heterocephalus glaber TaxID=10181 RepID=G5ANT3_HETGA|nr:Rabenosyn-5 [Heterocephalus glaber]